MSKVSTTGMSGRKLLWGKMLLHSESRRKPGGLQPLLLLSSMYAAIVVTGIPLVVTGIYILVTRQWVFGSRGSPLWTVTKQLSSWSAIHMEFYCWEWILQFMVENVKCCPGVLLSIHELWVHRYCGAQIQLWMRLILVVLLLAGQVSTAGFVPCHHVANILSIRFQLIRKWKNLTSHLAKQKENV